MTATRLREAAALMRSRAEVATPGPWFVDEEHGRDFTDEGWSEVRVSRHPVVGSKATEALALTAAMGWEGADEANEDAAHIASWHPAVALAVADLLDAVERAARLAGIAADHPEALSIRDRALAVADAYLTTAGPV